MMDDGRVLYVSPMAMSSNNGMMQRQHQMLAALCGEFPGRVDFLSLASSPASARTWLLEAGLDARVIGGPFAAMARLNTMVWYYGGAVLCNKLKWVDRFRFPFTTPLPDATIKRYSLIVCYYAWAYHLLALARAGCRVLVDLGDIMADRHERIGTRRWITLASEDEQFIVTGPSRCVAISDGDSQEFDRLYGRRLPVVPFVPPNASSLLDVEHSGHEQCVGFIGAPSYLNEEVLKLLAHEDFLGELRRHGVTLRVAGGICATVDRVVLDRLRNGGAQVLGRIDDILAFYAGVSAVLNPVGPSTGVKIKSVEALMAGRGLITTAWGTDDSLHPIFSEQITTVDWPVAPMALARACVEGVLIMRAHDRKVGGAYQVASAASLRSHLLA